MDIVFHTHDLPNDLSFDAGSAVAVDTEAMGLRLHRDRLCLVQLSKGDGVCHLVHIHPGQTPPKNLIHLLTRTDVVKIFHYGRFDIAALYNAFGALTQSVFCTKIASKLCRTYTDRHGLKDLCKNILGIEISKQEQTSDWGAETLSDSQKAYAATDVLHLHRLKERLTHLLEREQRMDIASAAFHYLPYRAKLDVLAGDDVHLLAY